MPPQSPLFASSNAQPRPAARLRVVVADDDRDTVLTLTALLRDEGHEARGLHNGDEVLDAMREFDPDAVILDIAMPGRSGFDLAKHIKQMRGEQKRPLIIGISGVYKQSADRILAKIVGFDKFLIKPYDMEAVLAALSPLTSMGR